MWWILVKYFIYWSIVYFLGILIKRRILRFIFNFYVYLNSGFVVRFFKGKFYYGSLIF